MCQIEEFNYFFMPKPLHIADSYGTIDLGFIFLPGSCNFPLDNITRGKNRSVDSTIEYFVILVMIREDESRQDSNKDVKRNPGHV